MALKGAEQQLEPVTADGWSTLPAELLEKVLEAMQADSESKPQEAGSRGQPLQRGDDPASVALPERQGAPVACAQPSDASGGAADAVEPRPFISWTLTCQRPMELRSAASRH